MNTLDFPFAGTVLQARAARSLYWPSEAMLIVSDLHLGKSGRMARRSGVLVPPYDVSDTLDRLEAELAATRAERLLMLGDTFDDDLAAAEMGDADAARLLRVTARCQTLWISGNHDPAPRRFAEHYRACVTIGGITFVHEAEAGDGPEISGHYHPKARHSERGVSLSGPAFLIGASKIIMPAFGTYTGGLWCDRPPLNTLVGSAGFAVIAEKQGLVGLRIRH